MANAPMASFDAARRTVDRSVDAKELTEFFCHHEGDIGFHSSFGGMQSTLMGVSGNGSTNDPHSWLLGRVWDCKNRASLLHPTVRTTIGQKVWRNLKRLDEAGDLFSIVVLFRMYGPMNPSKDYVQSFLDEASARLVTLTQAAADARDDLAFRRSSIRSDLVRDSVVSLNAAKAARLEEKFWTLAPRWEHFRDLTILDAAGKVGGPLEARARLWNQLGRLTEAMKACLVANGMDPLPPVLSAIKAADMETTVEEAIAHLIAEKKQKKGEKKPKADPAKAAFVEAVQRDANQIAQRAKDAYRMAKASTR